VLLLLIQCSSRMRVFSLVMGPDSGLCGFWIVVSCLPSRLWPGANFVDMVLDAVSWQAQSWVGCPGAWSLCVPSGRYTWAGPSSMRAAGLVIDASWGLANEVGLGNSVHRSAVFWCRPQGAVPLHSDINFQSYQAMLQGRPIKLACSLASAWHSKWCDGIAAPMSQTPFASQEESCGDLSCSLLGSNCNGLAVRSLYSFLP
jgi:hypothetical protein